MFARLDLQSKVLISNIKISPMMITNGCVLKELMFLALEVLQYHPATIVLEQQ